jgi:hypothetical protein
VECLETRVVPSSNVPGNSFSFADFSSTAGLQLNHGAVQAGNRLRMTGVGTENSGSAWFTSRQPVQDGFDTTFQFQITDPHNSGGDGFAFVIQNSGLTALGGGGQGIGYGDAEYYAFTGISNSVAVEFDTYQGGYDPNGNHISVHTRGLLPNNPDERYSIGSTTAIPIMEDGNVHTVRIEYAPGTMQIFMDDPATPRLVVKVDLSTTLSLSNGQAFVGFTGGEAVAYENHDILNWSYANSSVASLQTVLAVADFSADGKPDLVTTNPGANAVGVRLGNGDGTFAAAVTYGTGTTPAAVAVGDVNGDGHSDLVVANSGSNDVSVLLANGDGTFAAAVNHAVGANPAAVALGDLNADGNLDIITANSGSKSVSVLLGNGDGTFHSAVNYAARNNPNSVAVGDFNGDGKLDLAVANLHTVSILLGNGDGTFQAQTVFGANSPHGLQVEDVNHDGALDLVVENAHRVSVLLGNGDGTFQAPVYSGNGIQATGGAMADFNHDGVLDLVTANLHSVSVLLGNGDGTFQDPVYYKAGDKSRSVTVGDVNGDGKEDLIVTDQSGVSVLLGNGDGTFADPLTS